MNRFYTSIYQASDKASALAVRLPTLNLPCSWLTWGNNWRKKRPHLLPGRSLSLLMTLFSIMPIKLFKLAGVQWFSRWSENIHCGLICLVSPILKSGLTPLPLDGMFIMQTGLINTMASHRPSRVTPLLLSHGGKCLSLRLWPRNPQTPIPLTPNVSSWPDARPQGALSPCGPLPGIGHSLCRARLGAFGCFCREVRYAFHMFQRTRVTNGISYCFMVWMAVCLTTFLMAGANMNGFFVYTREELLLLLSQSLP